MPQLIGCTAVLAGTFAALIMIAGSHDTRAITAVLLVFAVLLSVPCARRWTRSARRAREREINLQMIHLA